MRSNNLDKEFQHYQSNKKKLLSKYEDKFIVIIDQSIVGAYSSRMGAINETKKRHKLGTFLVQYITKNEDEAFFHSRIIFNLKKNYKQI